MEEPGPSRVALLDAWRFAAMCLMLLYHALYDLALFGLLPTDAADRPWALALRYACAGSFILVSGAAARLGREPLRRGLTVLCAGALVCAVTALAGLPVRCGILELLGLDMLLYGLLRRRLEPAPGWLWAAGFVLTLPLLTLRVGVSWLYPLGLRTDAFFSADYWPLLPWSFLFLCGAALSPRLTRLPQPTLPRAVTALSRRSLLCYLLHQPVLLALCSLLAGRNG